jgi:hypothetical protein
MEYALVAAVVVFAAVRFAFVIYTVSVANIAQRLRDGGWHTTTPAEAARLQRTARRAVAKRFWWRLKGRAVA